MRFWITLKGFGTVFSTDEKDVAEEKWRYYVSLYDREVVMYADFNDGWGATIWKRH